MTTPPAPATLSSAACLRRHPDPVLTAAQVPFPATLVFNAGVTRWHERYLMVFRNDYGRWGDVRFDGTNLGIAESADGIAWTVRPRPLFTLEEGRALVAPAYRHRDALREVQRIYDPRLTVCEGRLYLCFAVDTAHGLRGGIAVSDDAERWTLCSLSPPDNRNMVLFPERIGGRWLRLDRPMPVYSRGRDRFDLWLSSSPDLRAWGDHQCLLGVEEVAFADDKLGPAAPPVRTAEGWLTTFHAVDRDDVNRGRNGWEPRWTKRYTAGIMLLDLADPARVLGICPTPLIAPETIHERDGFRNDVIFPGGMILEESGEVKIYYGATDTVECLATAHVDDLLRLCLEGC